MSEVKSPMQYLDKAMMGLRDLNLLPEQTEDAPVIALINQIADLDEEKTIAIARTLNQTSLFNEVVREQISAMKIGERYEDITRSFNSIREDAKTMVDQIEDGKIDTFERLSNAWMKVSRGDIPQRFEDIKTVFLEVAGDSNEQIKRERIIFDAYQDFRGALKQSEVLALEVLEKAQTVLDQKKASLSAAMQAVDNNTSDDPADRARLEMARDQEIRAVQDEDQRYQIAKDLADNLTVSYNTSEVIMARLMQTTSAKERVYQQSVSFFATNENVFTALSASFTGLFGLHESTQVLEAMKDGVSKSLEDLGEIGGKVQEAALRAGYGPTIRAESVKKLVDSVADFQQKSLGIINEMRELSTKNAEDIRVAVEDGKKRISAMVAAGEALPMPDTDGLS